MKNMFCNFCHTIEANEKRILLIMIVFTMLLRFFHVYLTYSHYGKTKWSDDHEYLYFGEQIALGNWNADWPGYLPFMQVGPGLPILIGISRVIFNNPVWPIFLYNIIITSLVVWVLFKLGVLVFNKPVGWCLAIWGVFYADFFKYNPYLLKEPTNYFFLPLTIYLLLKAINGNQPLKNVIFSAMSFTWLIHTDERYIIYFPLFIVAFLLVKPLHLKIVLRYSVLWITIVLILGAPWMIRNFRLFEQIVIISPRTTAITSKFWGSNLQNLEFSSESPVDKHIKRYSNAAELGKQHGISPRLYGKTEKYYRAFINFWQPTYFRATYIQNGYRFMKWSPRHNLMGLLFYGIFLPFYMLGFIWLIKKKQWTGLFIAVIPIIHSFVHTMMIWPLERYRSPVVFCVVLIGFWVIVEIHSKYIAHSLN